MRLKNDEKILKYIIEGIDFFLKKNYFAIE